VIADPLSPHNVSAAAAAAAAAGLRHVILRHSAGHVRRRLSIGGGPALNEKNDNAFYLIAMACSMLAGMRARVECVPSSARPMNASFRIRDIDTPSRTAWTGRTTSY